MFTWLKLKKNYEWIILKKYFIAVNNIKKTLSSWLIFYEVWGFFWMEINWVRRAKKNPHVIKFNENAINMLAMRGVEKFILINLNLKL